MKFRNIKKSAMVLALSASFVIPQVPTTLMAQIRTGQPFDLFPIDDEIDDTGLFPTNPTIPGNNGNSNGGIGIRPPVGGGPNNGIGGRPQQRPGKVSMFPAKVSEEYSCSLFDNGTNKEIFAAIDSLNKVVKPPEAECSGTGTPNESLQKSAATIKTSIANLQKLMQTQDPSTLAPNQIEQTVTTAVTAIGEIGTIIENNEFLNSKCGSQTMSSGKVLLALNEIINGLAPFALQAAGASPAALPFLIGGSVASSAIATVAKMSDEKKLSMEIPEHRKALLQNTCQFMKIAAKQRLMELAQDGKGAYVKSQLEKQKNIYKERYENPGSELHSLLSLREQVKQAAQSLEQQLESDRVKWKEVSDQLAANNDNLMVCIATNELVNTAGDGKSFPASAFANLDAATKMDPSQGTQAKILKNFNAASMKRIGDAALRSSDDERSLNLCAQASRSWVKSLQQTLDLTAGIVSKIKNEIDKKVSTNTGYSYWAAQYNRAKTIENFEKAIDEMEKDNSIDRSELAQRMKVLKAGLFGSRPLFPWKNTKSPVYAWIDHTKKQYDESIATFLTELKQIRDGSYSLTAASGVNRILLTPKLHDYSLLEARFLGNLNLNQLPAGTYGHERACKTLDAASSAFNSALKHLEAIQLFCNLVGPALDTTVDSDIVKACGEDSVDLKRSAKSLVEEAEALLNVKGFKTQAALVNKRQKDLGCPGSSN